jgi:hypothetical protein
MVWHEIDMFLYCFEVDMIYCSFVSLIYVGVSLLKSCKQRVIVEGWTSWGKLRFAVAGHSGGRVAEVN